MSTEKFIEDQFIKEYFDNEPYMRLVTHDNKIIYCQELTLDGPGGSGGSGKMNDERKIEMDINGTKYDLPSNISNEEEKGKVQSKNNCPFCGSLCDFVFYKNENKINFECNICHQMGFILSGRGGDGKIEKMKWINVKQELPDDGSKVLVVYFALYKEIMIAYYEDKIFHIPEHITEWVTHWMPLPELPE